MFGDECQIRTTTWRVHRLTMRVAAVLEPLRWRLGSQLLVDDLAFGRGVVST